MLKTRLADRDDFHQWIRLAQEVEPLFGPMVDDPSFHEGLKQAISCGDAFCVRKVDPEKGPALHGGIVISRESNEILWLAVAEASRGKGVGKALLQKALEHLDQGRPVTVTTFDGSVEAGLPSRRLYRMFGFTDSRPGGPNPAGIPTVIMVRI